MSLVSRPGAPELWAAAVGSSLSYQDAEAPTRARKDPSEATLYPINSFAVESVPSATVSSRDFVNGCAFLIVDFTGRFQTQRIESTQ